MLEEWRNLKIDWSEEAKTLIGPGLDKRILETKTSDGNKLFGIPMRCSDTLIYFVGSGVIQ